MYPTFEEHKNRVLMPEPYIDTRFSIGWWYPRRLRDHLVRYWPSVSKSGTSLSASAEHLDTYCLFIDAHGDNIWKSKAYYKKVQHFISQKRQKCIIKVGQGIRALVMDMYSLSENYFQYFVSANRYLAGHPRGQADVSTQCVNHINGIIFVYTRCVIWQ